MTSSKYIYNYPLFDNNYQKEFNLQYSYDKDPDKEESYFKTTKDGLKISIYKDDLSFLKGSKTDPRSEIRGLTTINDNIQYTVSWDQYLENYVPDFWFSFFQIFAKDGPNIMLRWKDNQYELLALQGRNKNITFKIDINGDVGRWVNWKIMFLLSPQGGYVRVYKDGFLTSEMKDANTSGGDDSYLKLGIYSQDMNPIDSMSMTIKNIQLS